MNYHRLHSIPLRMILVFGICLSFACEPESQTYITGNRISVVLPQIDLTAGNVTNVAIPVEVDNGFHLQANPASEPYLIPTRLTLSMDSGLVLGEPVYPEGKPFVLTGSDKVLSVYDGRTQLSFTIDAPEEFEPDSTSLTGELYYQMCDDRTCYPPASLHFDIPVRVRANS